MSMAARSLEELDEARSPFRPEVGDTEVSAISTRSIANLEHRQQSTDLAAAGERMKDFLTGVYPICRSITGNGFRDTLRQVRKHIPIEVREVPSGTKVFDWTVPKEWNIRDAWVKNAQR